MSQIISLKGMSFTKQTALQTELTVFNKVEEKRWEGKQSFTQGLTGKVECYKVVEGGLAVPFTKAREITGKTNDWRVHEKREFEKKSELYDHQKVMGRSVIEMLNKQRRCLLCVNTGGGKTVMSCVISAFFKYRTLVLLQNMSLVGQWFKTAEKFTTAKVWAVGEDHVEDPDFIVCHIRRIEKIPKDILESVGFLILDEAPLLCNQPGINAILSTTPKHILACSATPSRSRDGKYCIMESILGKENFINFKKKNSEEKKKNSEEKKSFNVVRLGTRFQGTMEQGAGGRLSWSIYIQSHLYNSERNEAILQLIGDYLEKGHRIMVITTEKAHVTILHKLLVDSGVDTDYLSGTKKKYNMCDVLVGNMQKCGVGFDEATFCPNFDKSRGLLSVVICVSYICNVEGIEQMSGRSRDDNRIVVQLVDNDSLARKNWAKSLAVYKECGANIERRTIKEY